MPLQNRSERTMHSLEDSLQPHELAVQFRPAQGSSMASWRFRSEG